MNHPVRSPLAKHWGLDSQCVFLNHGSFGATPFAIREEQRKWQDLLEEEPVRFYEDLAMGLHGELSQSTRRNAALRCRRLGNN